MYAVTTWVLLSTRSYKKTYQFIKYIKV